MSTEFKPDSPIDPPPKLEPGNWEGEYIDVKGVRGTLLLNIESADETIAGSYQLKLRVRDKPRVYAGKLEGKVEGGLVKLELTVGDNKEGGKKPDSLQQGRESQSEKLQYEAQLKSGGSYARQSLYGLAQTSPENESGGGVWIAWRFEK